MKRITVSVPDDLGALLEAEAKRRQVSIPELVRLCLASVLQGVGLKEAGAANEVAIGPAEDFDTPKQEGWAGEVDRWRSLTRAADPR